jgi:uncharacterized membrane protein YedE/YeeE
MAPPRDDHGDGIIALVKETADGLGQLVADHIKLARIEMTADAKTYLRELSMLTVGAFIFAVGYGLACIAAGTALARIMGGPLAFAGLAFIHVIVGAIALGVAVRRMKRVQLMQESKEEVSRSVSVLRDRALTARSF